MYQRKLNLAFSSTQTCFLWGSRQTGKSTLLKTLFPDAIFYDLLQADEYRRLLRNPELVRQERRASI